MRRTMLLLAACLFLTPLNTWAASPDSVAYFSSDTTHVVIVGNALTDSSITVTHELGRVLVNGYLVYPLPQLVPTVQQNQPLTSEELEHRFIIGQATGATTEQEAVNQLLRSGGVDTAWVVDHSIYFKWHGSSRIEHLYRTVDSAPAQDRSQEFFDELVCCLRSRSSVYIGTYLIQFSARQSALEQRVVGLALNASAEVPMDEKYWQVIKDLRAPQDLNALKVR